MVKPALAVCAIVLGVAMYGSVATAQEAPLDLGETNLLVLACGTAKSAAEAEGMTVRNCRRHAPDEVSRTEALIVARVVTDRGAFVLTFELQKSLWSTRSWTVEQG